jgi:hypothetical protein
MDNDRQKAILDRSLQRIDKPPAPEAWLTEASQGHGRVESKPRLPLSLTPNYDGGYLNSTMTALH